MEVEVGVTVEVGLVVEAEESVGLHSSFPVGVEDGRGLGNGLDCQAPRM